MANWLAATLLATSVALCGSTVLAQEVAQDDAVPERPFVPNRRWQEDWCVLADPRVKREPLDRLKYIPLSRRHRRTYLSLGFNLRERFEVDHSSLFGTVSGLKGEWLLSRMEVHADLRLGKHVQVFAQLQSAFIPGKKVLAPPDRDRPDLEQYFIGLTKPLGRGTVTLRVGRQLMDFDLQRFVSSREGPYLLPVNRTSILARRSLPLTLVNVAASLLSPTVADRSWDVCHKRRRITT